MKSNLFPLSFYENVVIRESFATVEVRLSSSDYSWGSITPIFSGLKRLCKGDSFALYLTVDSTPLVVEDTTESSEGRIKQHLNEMGGSSYEIQLNITKLQKNGILPVYCLDAFSEFLFDQSIGDLIKYLSQVYTNKLVFHTVSSLGCFGSKTIAFAHDPDLFVVEDSYLYYRDRCKSTVKDNGIFFELPQCFVPDDFYIEDDSLVPPVISGLFGRLCAIYSIAYLANRSEFSQDGKEFLYSMSGYRSVEWSWDIASPKLDHKKIFRVYSWIYSESKSADKLGLVRNIASLNIGGDSNSVFDDATWSAIHSNYQIYLKENVQQYLEIRSKMSEITIDSSAKLSELCNGFLDGFKNNALGIVSFLVGVIVVNGIKDNGPENLFSIPYIFVAWFVTIVSLLWLFVARRDTSEKMNFISDGIKSSLNSSYGSIIIGSEIDDLIDPIIKRNRDFISARIKSYSIFWLLTLLIFIAIFWLGGIYYHVISLPFR